MEGLIPLSTNRSRLSRLDESAVIGSEYRAYTAEGAIVVLRDPSGVEHRKIDLISAYGAVNFGHNNPEIRPFADAPVDLVGACMTSEADLFADWLCRKLNRPDDLILFQVGGSFAVSTALAMAQRVRPGRIISVRNGFHGLGLDALAATSVQREFALQETALLDALAGHVERLTPGKPADIDWAGVSCFLFEPIQGAAGYRPLPAEWLAETCSAARRAGVLLIADEIQCGYNRFGPFSPSQEAGLNPDMVLFSKSMTNGLYPLSAIVLTDEIESRLGGDGPRLAHTFQTSALGAYAALAVAKYLDAHDVVGDHVDRVGVPLRALSGRLEAAGLIRETSTVGPSLSFEPVNETAATLVRRAFDRGVMIFTGGPRGERVRIAPPLPIPDGLLIEALAAIEDSFQSR